MSEKHKYPLDGLVVSLNTPFNAEDRIDFRSVERLVELHLAEGAVGFLTPAQAAEVYELTPAERIDLLRCVRDVTRGRAKLIAGATASEQRASYLVAEGAIESGCDGVLVEVPEHRKQNRKAVLEFFDSFASLGMPMLMIQDLDWGGPGMEVDQPLEGRNEGSLEQGHRHEPPGAHCDSKWQYEYLPRSCAEWVL